MVGREGGVNLPGYVFYDNVWKWLEYFPCHLPFLCLQTEKPKCRAKPQDKEGVETLLDDLLEGDLGIRITAGRTRTALKPH